MTVLQRFIGIQADVVILFGESGSRKALHLHHRGGGKAGLVGFIGQSNRRANGGIRQAALDVHHRHHLQRGKIGQHAIAAAGAIRGLHADGALARLAHGIGQRIGMLGGGIVPCARIPAQGAGMHGIALAVAGGGNRLTFKKVDIVINIIGEQKECRHKTNNQQNHPGQKLAQGALPCFLMLLVHRISS